MIGYYRLFMFIYDVLPFSRIKVISFLFFVDLCLFSFSYTVKLKTNSGGFKYSEKIRKTTLLVVKVTRPFSISELKFLYQVKECDVSFDSFGFILRK